jgi:hypothetical protein
MSAVPDNSNNPDAVLERVRELTWALLDEQISSDEKGLLESLLLSCDEARKMYIGCVQLHADLAADFAAQKPAMQTTSPILGFLNAGTPPLSFPANSVGEL